jgi:hypothetical protein
MKIIPTKGYSSMSKKLARNRRTRNQSQPTLFEWAESQRRLIDRPTSAERMFRELGHSSSVARLRAAHAGFPVEGD